MELDVKEGGVYITKTSLAIEDVILKLEILEITGASIKYKNVDTGNTSRISHEEFKKCFVILEVLALKKDTNVIEGEVKELYAIYVGKDYSTEPIFYIKIKPEFEIFYKGRVITTEDLLLLLHIPKDIKYHIPNPTPLAADPKNKWLIPRYKVIALFPNCQLPIGFICKTNTMYEDQIFDKENSPRMRDFPAIFKKLEWWEDRTPEEWATLKKVKIVKYVGYWREGDVVNVVGIYDIFPGYKGQGQLGVLLHSQHFQRFDTVEPAE